MNTIEMINTLRGSGMDAKQAEAVAIVIEQSRDDLVTKVDLQSATAELRAEFHESIGKLTTTLWITQLSTIGIILVGIGLLVHFRV
jgi:hypothetical protein